MSVTAAQGFLASGIAAGIKKSGNLDLALVLNQGPAFQAAGVFTSNRIKAAPVLWSEQVLKENKLKAVVLNSGGANACTGPQGFADTHHTAEEVAKHLDCAPIEVAVCSTGLIGELLPMQNVLSGIEVAAQSLSANAGVAAAQAIMTTDSVPKLAESTEAGYTIGGMAKGAGMLAPGLATMLVSITTDADCSNFDLNAVLQRAVELSFNRIDSDGCMSTNDTVLLLANAASGVKPSLQEFESRLTALCQDLARQLIADAEGATKDIRIDIVQAANELDAVEAARAISRSNLLKCAIHGEDPNWGRVLAALGTTAAKFEPDQVDVALNGVWVCRNGMVGEDRALVDMSAREVVITVNLKSGSEHASLWTNDLTALYVHENSAYSS